MYAMTTAVKADVKLRSLLTSAVGRVERSASCLSRFTPSNRSWVCQSAGMDVLGKRKPMLPLLRIEPGCPNRSLFLYLLSYPGSHGEIVDILDNQARGQLADMLTTACCNSGCVQP
jgi:hypothetical protein